MGLRLQVRTGVFGVVVAPPGTLLDLRDGLRDRLAHLLGHGLRVLALVLAEDVPGGFEQRFTVAERAVPPVVERGLRVRQRGVDVVRRRLFVRSDPFAGRGVDDVHTPVTRRRGGLIFGRTEQDAFPIPIV